MYAVLQDHLKDVQDDRRDDPSRIPDKETSFLTFELMPFAKFSSFVVQDKPTSRKRGARLGRQELAEGATKAIERASKISVRSTYE